MKLTLLLTCLTALQISASVYSQNTKISLKSAQGNFGEIITAIEEQTDFKVFYKNEQIDLKRKIQLSASSASVADMLNQALQGTDLVYTLLDKIIVLSPKETSLAQQLAVKGVVTDETGQGLPGVNVVEKGTTNGTVTDVEGNFSINVSSPQAVLVFSFVGYTQTEVTVGNQTSISVSLKPDLLKLDEVVVVGYGVQKKKLSTGATLNVKGESLQRPGTINALQALQGQTPGVNITSTSGQPGEGMKVIVRGVGTIGNSGPLYVVDGVQTGDISYLNNSDIESIDVLKDAASCAIYGTAGANGVILVTTRQGKVGKGKVTLDLYTGVQNLERKMNMLNAQEYATIMNEQAVNSGKLPYFTNNEIQAMPGLAEAGLLGNQDWLDQMFVKNAKIKNVTLGYEGGSESSTYSTSLSYTDQAGIVGGSDYSNYSRIGIRINSEHKLYKDVLKVGQHLTLTNINRRGIQVGGQYSNTLRGAFNANPFILMYDPNSSNPYKFADNSSSTWANGQSNPYADMVLNNNSESNSQKVLGDIYLELAPIKNLKYKSMLSIEYNTGENHSFKDIYKISIYNFNDRYKTTQSMNKGYNWIWDNFATYLLNINMHQIELMAGTEAKSNFSTNINGNNSDLAFNGLEYSYLGNTTNKNSVYMGLGGGASKGYSISYFGRVNYNFKEKYMFNFTVRADGDSKFAPNHKWGYFPSLSAGWTVTNESFMDNLKEKINYLKIRASWGQNGNANIPNHSYEATITSQYTNYIFGNVEGVLTAGSYPDRIGNVNLTWETSEQKNIGFDLLILNNKLAVNFDWYNKTTKDWLIDATTIATSGVNSQYINGGNVENKGVEIMLGWNDHVGAFNYSIGANVAFNKNNVTEVPTKDGIIHAGSNELWNNAPEFYRAQSGYPVAYFWGYKTLGVFQNEAEVNSYTNSDGNLIQPTAKPGDLKFADVNNDGKISLLDKTKIGDPNPDYTYGFNINCSYKGFDLSILANGVGGNQLVQSYRNNTDPTANYPKYILNRWHGEGSSNSLPRLTEDSKNYIEFSDIFVKNGDFLRISNVTLGYDFSKLVKMPAISQLRLYFTAQNLLTLTKYNGMDPEVGYGNGFSYGVDYGFYPHPRIFLVGLNVKF